MRNVRISLKNAALILGSFPKDWLGQGSVGQAFAELRKAMEPKKSVKAANKTRRAQRKEHNAETSDIRAAVFARADDLCELCLRFEATDLQHCFGRIKRPQAVSNCLALCRPCHLKATRKRPESVRQQAEVLDAKGHSFAARELCGLANWLESKEEARRRMKSRAASMTREAQP